MADIVAGDSQRSKNWPVSAVRMLRGVGDFPIHDWVPGLANAWLKLMSAPTGRPFLFNVMRDFALDHGSPLLVEVAEHDAEMWERSPEEWELYRHRPDPEYRLYIPGRGIIGVPSEMRDKTTWYRVTLPPRPPQRHRKKCKKKSKLKKCKKR